MESGAIKEWQLTASSSGNAAGPNQARLNLKQIKGEKTFITKGAWIAQREDYHAWLQVYLKNAYTLITGVATQGGGRKKSMWVTKYKIQYWGTGVHVQFYKEQGQSGPFKVT